jgi:hypothetical protein
LSSVTHELSYTRELRVPTEIGVINMASYIPINKYHRNG